MAQEISPTANTSETKVEVTLEAARESVSGTSTSGNHRYPCRIPIRMTQAERATIGKKANALNRSISRYLVEAGVQDKHGQGADPARLRYLQILFQDAADKTRDLLTSPLFVPKNELTGDVKARLEEAAYLLKALSGELARRLS